METQREKYIKMLNESKKMMQDTIDETNTIKATNPNKKVADQEHFKIIDNMLDEQLTNTGVNVPKKEINKGTSSYIEPVNSAVTGISKEENDKQTRKVAEKNKVEKEDKVIKREIPENEKKIIEKMKEQENIKVVPVYDDLKFNISSTNKQKYDIIKLPSKGECYASKKGRLPIGYLTLVDENIMIQPNIFRDNLIVDILLKNKILDLNFDPDLLCKGDRDAIMLFLRASGYGTEFPIVATDPETGKEFDTTVDLSKIKYIDFKLKGDNNGWFDYTLPKSGDLIKFNFLNRIEEKRYLSLVKQMEEKEKKKFVEHLIKEIDKLDKDLIEDQNEQDILDKFVNTLYQMKGRIPVNETPFIGKVVSELVVMMVKAVKPKDEDTWITDWDEIRTYCENMIISDSQNFIKYVDENEPALDMRVTVEKPESLGGGSIQPFLDINTQSLFTNFF